MVAKDLLRDSDVRRWFENLCGGSEQTATGSLRILARLCRHLEATPAALAAQAEDGNGRDLEDRVHDFLQGQRKAGRTPGYLKSYVKVLRSWLGFHGLALNRVFKLGNALESPTVTAEQVPTGQQLRDLLAAATPRGRAVISLLAFSGVRPGVLGNYNGTDGLRLGDLPDLTYNGGVVFGRAPAMVRVRPKLSKASHPYLTFLGEEGIEHVRRYLQARLDGGEELRPDSPVIRCRAGFEHTGKTEGAANWDSPFITTANVSQDVRKGLDKCNWEARPYVLRRYFELQLFDAAWKNLVPRDWVTFWAGHKGDIEHIYTLHKGIPDGVMEDMRGAYVRAEPYLSTVRPGPEGREIYATDVSSEPIQLLAQIPSPELAHKSNQDKLRAFMLTAIREGDETFKAAMREALRD